MVCAKHKKNPVKIYKQCIGCEVEGYRDENAALRAAIKLCWAAFDGLYGGDAFEALPIEVMTPDRRNACNAALEAIGALEI
jgi:hypothetical protein